MPNPAVPNVCLSIPFERDSIEPLLIKIVHVLAIPLAVGDDVQSEFRLIACRPLDEARVDFRNG